jgi:hypothetical protein
MVKAGKEAGFQTQVLNKKQIEALKMGGLLGVNKGSIDPPTFTIMEYKPKNAKNKKPIVLVGKGVVFDTGGLSLKPTPGSMDEMKCDMAGGAAVVGAIYAIAANKLPVHVVALVPATDNRPGGNAVCPQDVLTISDGTTVEVLNTDAEGRLILADALVYAKKYKPELVIDLATLTGAAVRSIGTYASAVMATADQQVVNNLMDSGFEVWERLIHWVDEENQSASTYVRLCEAADLYELGNGGLWRDPELQVAWKWKEDQIPNAIWASRYNDNFEKAILFLSHSKEQSEQEKILKESRQKKRLKTARRVAIVIACFGVMALFLSIYSFDQRNKAVKSEQIANSEKVKAEKQKKIADDNKLIALEQKGVA